ncbi:MAG: glycosyltransferase family 9 protein [Verrucomicrobiota bacterium]
MKILVISLAGIGDTLFATPLIRELRANFPEAVIDAFVLWPGSRDVLEGNPHLNTVFQKNLITESPSDSLSYLWQLRARRYDLSINTHPQSRRHYRIVARILSATTRASHSYDHADELDHWLVNKTLPQNYECHSADNNLALLELIGAKPKLPRHRYEIFFTEAEENWAAELLAGNKLAGRQLLGVHVGSGGTKNLALRRWPPAHYIELFRELNRKHPEVSVLLMGGPEEKTVHEFIMREVKSPLVIQPATRTLRQAAALIKRCHTFLSVDTSLMHVAAAVEVPQQIVIETPTLNRTVVPYGREFTLVPNPSVAGRNLDFYRYDGAGIRGSANELIRCMSSVSVETVFASVTRASAPG